MLKAHKAEDDRHSFRTYSGLSQVTIARQEMYKHIFVHRFMKIPWCYPTLSWKHDLATANSLPKCGVLPIFPITWSLSPTIASGRMTFAGIKHATLPILTMT